MEIKDNSQNPIAFREMVAGEVYKIVGLGSAWRTDLLNMIVIKTSESSRIVNLATGELFFFSDTPDFNRTSNRHMALMPIKCSLVVS